jgi:transcriptional regulator with XRE-family HTH domain
MDISQQVREFLMTRRARVTPAQVGLPPGGGRRRVAGLRREEVAVLAGVSTEYYSQIERGDIARASEEVLDAIASALQLDDVERGHLFDLSRAAGPRRRASVPTNTVHANVQQLMDAMPGLPSTIQNGRLDLLGTNSLGRALYADVYDRYRGPGVPNLARFVFLDDRSREMFPEWNVVAADAVATLQVQSARTPRAKAFVELIGQLSTLSVEFRALWATRNVSAHRRGSKRIHHREVGELVLGYEALELPGAQGLQMVTFLPEPGSPTADALRVLGSWTATAARVVEDVPLSRHLPSDD